MSQTKILIAGEHDDLWAGVSRLFTFNKFALIPVGKFRQVKFLVRRHNPSIAICILSCQVPEVGMRMISEIRESDRTLPIILITNQSSETLAIEALRAGANDYFKLPFSDQELLSSCQRLVKGRSAVFLKKSNVEDKEQWPDELMIGNSQSMREIKSYLSKIAKTDSTVLITGETGTGKEVAAELIHKLSPRKEKPFICVNCAALPETLVESELFGFERGAFTGAVATQQGKFEAAGAGTILLDEVGDMPLSAQAKILRSIENKQISHLGGQASIPMNARVIAATNQNPEHMIEEGQFRKDLFYRLNVVRVHIPPLRDRKKDIPLLANHAISKLNRKFGYDVEGLSDESLDSFYRYHWPGNVRELFNCLEASLISLPQGNTKFIELPGRIQKQLELVLSDPNQERCKILQTLMETKWNKSEAAKKLSWSRVTLYRKIEKYNIIQNRKLRQASQ